MTDHLTPSELALREAAEKATKGEWKTDSLGIAIHTTKAAGASPGWVPVISNKVPDDAAYIVAAQPGAVLALLDEIERLREALRAAEEALTRHIPEGHGPHPNPEFIIVEQARAALAEKQP